MTTTDEILILANQLANKGIKPTVAAIKAKLKNSVTLPELISTLKSWQHDPSFVNLPQENQTTNDKPENKKTFKEGSFEHELHNELAIMKSEILELKTLIKELINQQQK